MKNDEADPTGVDAIQLESTATGVYSDPPGGLRDPTGVYGDPTGVQRSNWRSTRSNWGRAIQQLDIQLGST